MFTSSTQREIKHFHAVVLQWLQKKCTKTRDACAKLLFLRPRLHTKFYLCSPFTRDRANSVTNNSTVCISKTCTVPRVPCKRKAGPCKFLSVQKFKGGLKLLWRWCSRCPCRRLCFNSLLVWVFGSEWCSPFVFVKDWGVLSIPSGIILSSDVVFIGDTGRNC